jgi:hypothetical protein
MIVRISGENQYRLDDGERERLNELERAVIVRVDAGDEQGFGGAYQALLEFVRANGSPIGEDEIETSDVILPPSDLTLEEAGREFTGEGLIPD